MSQPPTFFGKICAMAFNHNNKPVGMLFPEYAHVSEIHQEWRSPKANRKESSYSSPFILQAIGLLLSGKVQYSQITTPSQDALWIQYPSSSSSVKRVLVAQESEWSGVKGATGIWLIPLIQAILYPKSFPEIRAAWGSVLHAFSTNEPLYPEKMAERSKSYRAKEALFHLVDCLYYGTKEVVEDIILEDAVHNASCIPWNPISWLFQIEAHTPDTIKDSLKRLTRRGGAALLVGPPGTFKTERAKQVALEIQADLIIIEGRPGLEDKDFIGQTLPSSELDSEGRQTFKFMDGPLLEAVAKGAQGKVVLILDELLRFEPYHLNVIVGFLNTIDQQQGAAMGLELAAGRHYFLQTPSEILTCPIENLTIIATTNMGDDFVQSGQLDAALLGRFKLVLETDRVSRAMVMPVLLSKAGGNDTLAQAAYQLEVKTYDQTQDKGKLLLREANPRQTLQLIEETLALIEDGVPPVAAFEQAVELTWAGYCCERDSSGRLNSESKSFLMDCAREVAKTYFSAQSKTKTVSRLSHIPNSKAS